MGARKLFDEAVAAHRRAVRHLDRARRAADASRGRDSGDRHRDLVEQLARAGADATPDWSGTPLSRAVEEVDLGGGGTGAVPVRIGECSAAGTSFPVVVNVLGTGHIAVDVDSPAARGLAVDVTLRLLATRPSRTLGVWVVAGDETAFTALKPLADAGIVETVARDRAAVDAVLDQAEAQVARAARRRGADMPERLLVASLGDADGALRHRVARLADDAAGARIHMVLTGWRDATGSGPLPATTYVSIGATTRVAGVPLPVALDPAADSDVVAAVAARLIADSAQWTIPEV